MVAILHGLVQKTTRLTRIPNRHASLGPQHAPSPSLTRTSLTHTSRSFSAFTSFTPHTPPRTLSALEALPPLFLTLRHPVNFTVQLIHFATVALLRLSGQR